MERHEISALQVLQPETRPISQEQLVAEVKGDIRRSRDG